MSIRSNVNRQNQEDSISEHLSAYEKIGRANCELTKGTKDEKIYKDFLKSTEKAQKSFNKLLAFADSLEDQRSNKK